MHYLLFLILLFSSQTHNCGCEDKPQINVLAVVNGIKITKQDLSIDARTQVSIAQDTVIAARGQALNQLINKTLLEKEAKRRGLTPAKLYELEVTAKIAQPTEKEARALYDQNKERIAGNFKQVKNSIITQFRNEREAVRSAQFANSLRAGAQISVSEQRVTPPTSEEDLSRVFATINDVNITSRDIEEGLLPLIFSVQQQVYALRKQDLDVKINDLLLEQEAERTGKSPRALILENIGSILLQPTEKELREFYEANKATMPGDLSDHKVEIMQLMMAQAKRKQVLAYAEKLRKRAAIQVYLTAPEPPNLRQLCCNPVDQARF
jgi:hypothetical protein